MINNLDALNAVREKARKAMNLRLERGIKSSTEFKDIDIETCRKQVLVCGGTGCTSSDSEKIILELQRELEKYNLTKEIKVIKTGCFGLCALGPIMIVYPEGSFYSRLKVENIPEIVKAHLIEGKPVRHLLYSETIEDDKIKSLSQTPFYSMQRRIALSNCGFIDPENIEEYIAVDGYKALYKVVTEMTPEDVIKTIKDSGLRGRGGGGFPTGVKWELASKNQSDEKYVCCNADEGDPGAFMDRSILEGDPHTIIEAMAIAGYGIGASKGYIYVRAEYPIAVKRLTIAIEQARRYGFLNNNIFSSEFNFDIELRLGAGAFVCGEETALLTSIEGKRGEPHPRPPFPAVCGLYDKPTVLNNVETYANVVKIINNGANWFNSIGTEKSKGTKVFALGGKINHTGLVEVPMGTTLREIVYDIGGGLPNGKNFKAAQTGGPSGGCIPKEYLDIKIDYDNLVEIGSMMGSGGLIVMDEDTCMVDIAKFFLEFTVDESCGKCTPCRVGTKRLLEILNKITSGQATMADIDKMEELCHYIKANSLCGLGQTAPNPVLSTLKYFRDEYEAHVKEKRCPAGVCKSLLKYVIMEDKCKGCTACARVCPVGAIKGEVKKVHKIDDSKCIKCGACKATCKFGAVKRI